MLEYTKINTLFKRDMANRGRIIEGDWALPEFDYLKDNRWIFTEKVDGTNIRVMWNGQTVAFGGRTDAAQIPATLIAVLQKMFPPEKLHGVFGEGHACLYGEGYGPKIQNGGNYRKDQSFVLFDVLVDKWWLERDNIEDVGKRLAVDVAPIIGAGSLDKAIEKVKGAMQSTWGSFIAEGIVARPAVTLLTRKNERLLAKIKHRDFATGA